MPATASTSARTEKRHTQPSDLRAREGRCLAQWLFDIGVAIPSLLSCLAALASLAGPIAFSCAALVALSGGLYGRRVRGRQTDRRYRSDARLRRLLRTAHRFSLRWTVCGVVLAVVALLTPVPFVTTLLAACVFLFTFVNGIAIEGDIAAREEARGIRHVRQCRSQVWVDRISRVPLVRGVARLLRKRPPSLGDVGIGLVTMLLAVLCSATRVVGLAIGEMVEAVRGGPEGERQDQPRQRRSVADVDAVPAQAAGEPVVLDATYAELCIEFPDPLALGHGLGRLFHRAGGLIAGCGQPALSVGDLESVWYAEGTCSGETRSLGVVSPEYTPVLLLGEAAPFAGDAAARGELLFADAAEPGNGVVYAVGTTSGTYFFVASSPVFETVPEGARRCSEVPPTNSLIELSPSLAWDWLCQLEDSGWVWPVRETDGTLAFLDRSGDELVEETGGDCSELAACGYAGASCEPAGEVTLAALARYMPPPDSPATARPEQDSNLWPTP